MNSLSIVTDKDEKILHIAKKHWFSLFWPLIISVFLSVFIIPVIWFFYALFRFLWDEIIITDKKIYIKTGVFSKSTITTPIDKVHNINISKGVIGRMLDYGTIVIQSGATLGASGYSYIRSPERVQYCIEHKIID